MVSALYCYEGAMAILIYYNPIGNEPVLFAPIHFYHCCGSGFHQGPGSGFNQGPGSGSRRAKMTHPCTQNRKKLIISFLEVLDVLFYSLDVFYVGRGISKLQFETDQQFLSVHRNKVSDIV
jgi:hypothetical protein